MKDPCMLLLKANGQKGYSILFGGHFLFRCSEIASCLYV